MEKVHIESLEESINRIERLIGLMEERAQILEGTKPGLKDVIAMRHPHQAKQWAMTIRIQIPGWREQIEKYQRFLG